jgi:hypothetical protein
VNDVSVRPIQDLAECVQVRMLCSLLILGDPPKSLWRRLLAHAGVMVLVCLSFALWVLTLDWLGAAL